MKLIMCYIISNAQSLKITTNTFEIRKAQHGIN